MSVEGNRARSLGDVPHGFARSAWGVSAELS